MFNNIFGFSSQPTWNTVESDLEKLQKNFFLYTNSLLGEIENITNLIRKINIETSSLGQKKAISLLKQSKQLDTRLETSVWLRAQGKSEAKDLQKVIYETRSNEIIINTKKKYEKGSIIRGDDIKNVIELITYNCEKEDIDAFVRSNDIISFYQRLNQNQISQEKLKDLIINLLELFKSSDESGPYKLKKLSCFFEKINNQQSENLNVGLICNQTKEKYPVFERIKLDNGKIQYIYDKLDDETKIKINSDCNNSSNTITTLLQNAIKIQQDLQLDKIDDPIKYAQTKDCTIEQEDNKKIYAQLSLSSQKLISHYLENSGYNADKFMSHLQTDKKFKNYKGFFNAELVKSTALNDCFEIYKNHMENSILLDPLDNLDHKFYKRLSPNIKAKIHTVIDKYRMNEIEKKLFFHNYIVSNPQFVSKYHSTYFLYTGRVTEDSIEKLAAVSMLNLQSESKKKYQGIPAVLAQKKIYEFLQTQNEEIPHYSNLQQDLKQRLNTDLFEKILFLINKDLATIAVQNVEKATEILSKEIKATERQFKRALSLPANEDMYYMDPDINAKTACFIKILALECNKSYKKSIIDYAKQANEKGMFPTFLDEIFKYSSLIEAFSHLSQNKI